MQRGTEPMTRKTLFFTLLLCAALPAHAQTTDRYCISAEKLTQMHDQVPYKNPDPQRAYQKLFEILVAKNDSIQNAGCFTKFDMAQICKSVWDNDTDSCEKFVYEVTEEPAKADFKPLTYSDLLEKTDFSDIDANAFQKALNKSLARRREKHIPSKLQDMGTVFVEQAKEKQINPFLAAAIAMYESTYGTSAKARNLNNIAGLRGGNGYIRFKDVPDSIATQASTLRTWIATKTLGGLANSGHYCEKVVASRWTADVASIARVLYRNYNAILQGQN